MDIVNNSEDDIVVYLKAEIGEDVYAQYLAAHPDAPGKCADICRAAYQGDAYEHHGAGP